MRFSRSSEAFGLIASLATTVSSLVTFSPGPSYSVGIPSGSAISSSSTGPLYFQLSAPTSYQWVGLGIGTQMAGATIFVMYADGTGNVTLSARSGTGEVEPKADSTIQAGITLLEGSGIVGGNMIANVKCTSCQLDSAADSTNSPWIAAWYEGDAADSTSLSYNIPEHSGNSYAQENLDLKQATISTDSNPFISTAASSGSSPSGTGSSSSPTSSSSSSGSGSSGSSSGASSYSNPFNTMKAYQKAHGILGALTFVVLFPLGAVAMRMGSSMVLHAGFQMLTVVAMIAALGTGVKLAKMEGYVGSPFSNSFSGSFSGFGRRQFGGPGGGFNGGGSSGSGSPFGGGSPSDGGPSRNGAGGGGEGRYGLFNNTHTTFGLVIIILMLLQPLFGILHHINYNRLQRRTPVSHVHIWYGRIVMLLGVINGGLGLKLAGNSRKGKIAYGVVAGLIGAVYLVLVVLKGKGKWDGDGDGGLMGSGKGGNGLGREKTGGSNGSGEDFVGLAELRNGHGRGPVYG